VIHRVRAEVKNREIGGKSFMSKDRSRLRNLRRVSTTLRHSGVEFREYFRLSFVVC
jgi:hypothetical protein